MGLKETKQRGRRCQGQAEAALGCSSHQVGGGEAGARARSPWLWCRWGLFMSH